MSSLLLTVLKPLLGLLAGVGLFSAPIQMARVQHLQAEALEFEMRAEEARRQLDELEVVPQEDPPEDE